MIPKIIFFYFSIINFISTKTHKKTVIIESSRGGINGYIKVLLWI
jgi:hypothetical protein